MKRRPTVDELEAQIRRLAAINRGLCTALSQALAQAWDDCEGACVVEQDDDARTIRIEIHGGGKAKRD